MGTPPPPPAPRPAGVDALAVTLKVGDRAIGARVNVRGGDLAPDAPVQVCARRDGDGWIVDGPDGPARLGPRDTVVVDPAEGLETVQFRGGGDPVAPSFLFTHAQQPTAASDFFYPFDPLDADAQCPRPRGSQ